jgi:hypothetical protein
MLRVMRTVSTILLILALSTELLAVEPLFYLTKPNGTYIPENSDSIYSYDFEWFTVDKSDQQLLRQAISQLRNDSSLVSSSSAAPKFQIISVQDSDTLAIWVDENYKGMISNRPGIYKDGAGDIFKKVYKKYEPKISRLKKHPNKLAGVMIKKNGRTNILMGAEVIRHYNDSLQSSRQNDSTKKSTINK